MVVEYLHLFSSNGNNLFLFLAQVETVFLGTPYFSATSLFDIPFSRSFNALHFSIRDLFLCIRLCGAMIMRKVSVKKRFGEKFLKTSNQNIRKFEFRILSEIWMKVRVNERKPSKGLTKVFEKSRNSSYRDSSFREFFCRNYCVTAKGPENLFEF